MEEQAPIAAPAAVLAVLQGVEDELAPNPPAPNAPAPNAPAPVSYTHLTLPTN